MPVTTASAAVHIAPVVLKTFVKHTKNRKLKLKTGDSSLSALDDIYYDEAFHVVKAFIELGMKNTVESLQAFTNTHVPAPYWVAVVPIKIPLSACNTAADTLIEWFDPEELARIVGGERWWQVRGLDWIDAEWITEKEFLRDVAVPDSDDVPRTEEETTIRRMEELDRVLLYVHGGGYYWGSINTHRYQVIRYAKKIRGRAFAVNYRKAPQYPWPCPLQDVLAAYFYLTRPPAGAAHKPVSPSKLVLAGDSAGAALCVSVLTVLRDLGLPQPAGAVLISPWVDLTHSFPSVLDNVETDIIPPHGFIHKPSALWPVHARSEGEYVREVSTTIRGEDGTGTDSAGDQGGDRRDEGAEAKALRVLMEAPDAAPWDLYAQIQLYATTEQLSHPLVSPVVQSSLGNLCPLYIIAGDGERLRDEIIYLAHKAAHPKEYPSRSEVMQTRRQRENAERFQTPTQVHLQVFDDLCHVLTVFTFTTPGKYAYNSIADFVKHVIDTPEEQLRTYTFPGVSGTKEEVGINNAKNKEDDTAIFIRERVDPLGHVRNMEPAEKIPALCMNPCEIGIVKEKPVRLWLEGQGAWDKRFKGDVKAVILKRKHHQAKWEKLLKHAKREGLVGEVSSRLSGSRSNETDRRWGPLDLEGERPPPTAIVGRRDTREAVALLKKVYYHSSPATHHRVHKRKISHTMHTPLGPRKATSRAPAQSVAEQQVQSRLVPMHGLKMWQSLVESFMRKSRERVANGGKHCEVALGKESVPVNGEGLDR